ncbi:MAG: twin-arginine translocase subunit TatC, partial [Muribaculaceae bacterium]|nr:twin-arginine translocase subunit TatC [Muribaculaceae bacterium]
MSSEQQMSFWEHLDDLRRVLFRIIVVMAVLVVACFAFMPQIFDAVIMAPCSGTFPTYAFFDRVASAAGIGADLATDASFKVDIVSLELASQLFIHLSASCWTALMLGFPFIIYMLWTFVSPALYQHERRNARTAFVFGNVMFYLGVACGYFLIFPLAVRFLADYQLSDLVPNVISLDSYTDTFVTIVFLMGVVFELPLLAWLLGRMGLLTRRFFSLYRRHAIVALMVLAAVITPTGDPFTLFAVFIPIYMLWE